MKSFLSVILAVLVTAPSYAQTAIQNSGSSTQTASTVSSSLYCEDSGGDDDYVCTLSPVIGSLSSGLTVSLKVATANTGAATVNVSGLGIKSIKKAVGGVTTDPANNDIRAGQVVLLAYDGTNFQIQSTLGNAGAGTGDALVANPLSQFASTTSTQLAGVISDETGSGALVFGTSPTLTTPTLGAASGTSINLSGAATVGAGVNYCADAGVSDAYACSLSPAITAYSTGTIYTFKANTANTGAATLNLNSLGAKTIVKTAGGITTTLADNDIRAGSIVEVVYDGTNLQLISASANAASGGSGITVGTTTITSGTATRILRESAGNVVTEDANLVNDGSTVTTGTGISGTARGANFNNGTSTGPSACAQDNGSDTWCFLDGGAFDKASGNALFSLAGSTRFEFQGSGINDWWSPSYGIFRLHKSTSDYLSYLAPGYAQTLTESSATGVLAITVPNNTHGAVDFSYSVSAHDSTDYQTRSGSIQVALVNKAGTITCALSGSSETTDGSAVAATTGTLTYAITCTVSGTTATVKFNAVSSLVQTYLKLDGFWAIGKSSDSGFSIVAAS